MDKFSSSKETIFGDLIERVAINADQKIHGGDKSAAEGIDLETKRQKNGHSIKCLVAIKSGPNWGNSSQVKKMITDMRAASVKLRTSGHKEEIRLINGCCYGRPEKNPHKPKGYEKLVGRAFWEFITDESSFYKDMIVPIQGVHTEKAGGEIKKALGKKIDQLETEIARKFTHEKSDELDYQLILKYQEASRKKS